MISKQLSREEAIKLSRAFRFTWHLSQEGATVWTTYRGNWVEGVIAALGRTTLTVTIATQKGKPKNLRRPYPEVRSRRLELGGDDIPTDLSPRQEAAESRLTGV